MEKSGNLALKMEHRNSLKALWRHKERTTNLRESVSLEELCPQKKGRPSRASNKGKGIKICEHAAARHPQAVGAECDGRHSER